MLLSYKLERYGTRFSLDAAITSPTTTNKGLAE
jgi:hypothetical protein